MVALSRMPVTGTLKRLCMPRRRLTVAGSMFPVLGTRRMTCTSRRIAFSRSLTGREMSLQGRDSDSELFNLCILDCYLSPLFAHLGGEHAHHIRCGGNSGGGSGLSTLEPTSRCRRDHDNGCDYGTEVHGPPLNNIGHSLEPEGDVATPSRSVGPWWCHLNELHLLDDDLSTDLIVEILE